MADGTIDIIDTTLLSTAAKQDVEHADLVAILNKISADPATQTTLAAVLAKLIASPSTEAKQDTGNTFLSTLAGAVNAFAVIIKPKSGLSYNSAALERSCVASAVAASPSMVRMWNAGASTRFGQGHNATSLPGNGAIPNDVFSASASAAGFINYVAPSDSYDLGVVYACSTTPASLTITGANDALFSVHLFAAGA